MQRNSVHQPSDAQQISAQVYIEVRFVYKDSSSRCPTGLRASTVDGRSETTERTDADIRVEESNERWWLAGPSAPSMIFSALGFAVEFTASKRHQSNGRWSLLSMASVQGLLRLRVKEARGITTASQVLVRFRLSPWREELQTACAAACHRVSLLKPSATVTICWSQ